MTRSPRSRLALVPLALITGVAGTLAAGTSAAVAARDHQVRVFGLPHGQSGLGVSAHGCDGASPAQVGGWRTVYNAPRAGNPYGPHALGFAPDNTDSEKGVFAFRNNPAKVSVFGANVFHAAASVGGQARVEYYPNSRTGSVWVGTENFNDAIAGWHRLDASRVSFNWTHYSNSSTPDATAPAAPLATFVGAHRGPHEGARFSFNFGCDQATVFVDGLRIGTSQGVDVYNLDAPRPAVSISSPHHSTCQVSAPHYPARVKLKGSTARGPVRLGFFNGRHTRGLGKVRGTGRFATTVRSGKSGYFTASVPSTASTEAGFAKVYVPVFPKITMTGARSARRGSRLTVRGTISPHLPLVYVVLLSHQTRHGWSPFVRAGKGRADRHGHYAFRAPTGRTGRFRVNVYTFQTHNISSTINRGAHLYSVTAKPRPVYNPPQQQAPSTPTQTPPPPSVPAPPAPSHRTIAPRSALQAPLPRVHGGKHGFGPCGWVPTQQSSGNHGR